MFDQQIHQIEGNLEEIKKAAVSGYNCVRAQRNELSAVEIEYGYSFGANTHKWIAVAYDWARPEGQTHVESEMHDTAEEALAELKSLLKQAKA